VLVGGLLAEHGHEVRTAATFAELLQEIDDGVGVVVLAGEAVGLEAARSLLERLAGQPSWSDLPLVVLTSRRRGPAAADAALAELREEANVTLLERPIEPVTLLSAVRFALRARVRQYQVRDYLDERARAEEQARRVQRLEAVGQLAGGVAHEVNNMMTVVLGFGEFAMRRLPESHPARAEMQEVVRAGERAAAITQQLLAFSRRQHTRPSVLSIADVVRDLGKLLQQLLGAEYRLHCDIAEDTPRVRADRTQLEQVLVNLVLNARDATRPGGTVSITGGAAELDAAYAGRREGIEIRSGRYALLAVSDTGIGMTPEAADRAFEPFFTTKPVGQGTGLGLSTVYGIVKQAEGYVWLYSERGVGTTAKVYLPAVADAVPAPERRQRIPARGSERILVVEDEEMVRQLARRALEAHGYDVLDAANGRDALALLEGRDAPVDLVLCDVVMPEMNGREVGVHLARTAPEVPLLYMSGYTGQDVLLRELIAPDAPFIQKPFTPEGLAARVRGLLDAAAARQGAARAGG